MEIVKIVNNFYDRITPVIEKEVLFNTSYVEKFIIPAVCIAYYLIMLFLLPKIQKRKRWLNPTKEEWKAKHGNSKKIRPLNKVSFVWNIMLVIYSGITFGFFFFETISVFIENKGFTEGFLALTCNANYQRQNQRPALTFWGLGFAISKIFEFNDTLLLILKKPERPIRFLHSFHHVTAFLVIWAMMIESSPIMTICACMNTGVHTVMYFYFALTDQRIFLPVAIYLTSLQFLQFVVGITSAAIVLFKNIRGNECSGSTVLSGVITLLYGSYLYLFGQFFVSKYIKKPKKRDQ